MLTVLPLLYPLPPTMPVQALQVGLLSPRHIAGGGAETPFLHLHSSCWCLPRTNARSQRQALTSKATVKLLAEMLNCHAPRGSVPCLTSHLAQET